MAPPIKLKPKNSNSGSLTIDAIEIKRTPGTPKRGGGKGGEAWVVLANGERAGTAYINIINDSIRGIHPSIHLYLNRPSQGRHIGRIAYQLCCELSKYDVVYAHMRKSNIASRKAAEYAGFIAVTEHKESQLVLMRSRNSLKTDNIVQPSTINIDP